MKKKKKKKKSYSRFEFDNYVRGNLLLSAKGNAAIPSEAQLVKFLLYLICHLI